MRGDTEEEELTRCVIREIRATKSDIGAEMRVLQEMLGRPVAVVSSVFRYMPDGRAVRLPAGFGHEVNAVARVMGLALFNPVPLVIDYGVDRAIIEGSRHYSDAFLPVMGEALAKFAASVARSQP